MLVIGADVQITSTRALTESGLLSERKSYLETINDELKVCESNSSYPDLGKLAESGSAGMHVAP